MGPSHCRSVVPHPDRVHLTAATRSYDARKATRPVEPGTHPSDIGHTLTPTHQNQPALSHPSQNLLTCQVA